MNMLVETLGMVRTHPVAWGTVAALTLGATIPVVRCMMCPYLAGRRVVSPEEAREELSKPFAAGTGFALTMVVGIVSILAGLKLIAYDLVPAYGFVLVVAGVFVVQTEPARLRLREAMARVIAAQLEDNAAQTEALARLRYSHAWLIAINLIIVMAVVAALLAF